MSKRKRRTRDEARPADEKTNLTTAAGSVLDQPEAELTVSGPAFEEFAGILDAQLDALVNRWSHVAAPSASSLRRVVAQGSRRTSEQA
jgi:hypothetical protein